MCVNIDCTVTCYSKACTILNINNSPNTICCALVVKRYLLAVHVKSNILTINNSTNISILTIGCLDNIGRSKVEVAEQLDSVTVLSSSKRLGKVAVNLSANLNSRSQLDILAGVEFSLTHLVDTADVECNIACTILVDVDWSLCTLECYIVEVDISCTLVSYKNTIARTLNSEVFECCRTADT